VLVVEVKVALALVLDQPLVQTVLVVAAVVVVTQVLAEVLLAP
jgi:hypothetical protein